MQAEQKTISETMEKPRALFVTPNTLLSNLQNPTMPYQPDADMAVPASPSTKMSLPNSPDVELSINFC
jgi:hypothetical protein